MRRETAGWKWPAIQFIYMLALGYLGAFAAVLDKPSVSLVPEEEVQTLFPDCETGAMPPFGHLYGMPVYVDKCFPKAGEFTFQAGNHHEVVRMKYAEYERLARPVVAEFCRH